MNAAGLLLLGLPLLLPLTLPRGGTLLEFAVDGKADEAKLEAAAGSLEFETWDCGKHPAKDPGKIQLPTCRTCGKAMVRVEPDPEADRHIRVDLDDGHLRVVSGPWQGIGMLRYSAIEKVAKDAGLTTRLDGSQLRGHILFEVAAGEKADRKGLAKALAPFGEAELDAKDALVLVQLAERKGKGHEHAALVKAIEDAGYKVKDTLWIMNQCSGELATVP